jgi:hypothetical protein
MLLLALGGSSVGAQATGTKPAKLPAVADAKLLSPPKLKVSRTGSGTGTVTGPGGLNCGTACAADVGVGTHTLTAVPDKATSYFAGWSGNVPPACATTPSCAVAIVLAGAPPITLVARFERLPRLSVAVLGDINSGQVGMVTATRTEWCNGTSGRPCSFLYAPGERVTLKTGQNNLHRAPDFVEWRGASGCGAPDDCVIAMGTSDMTVTAAFLTEVSFSADGAGTGVVSSVPPGIGCTAPQYQCGSVKMKPGALLTVTVAPTRGFVVDRWGYMPSNAAPPSSSEMAQLNACGTATTCTFSSNVTFPKVTLKSASNAQMPVRVAKVGTGTGQVSGSFGLSCGNNCSALLGAGSYTLNATADDATSYFAGWSGDVPPECATTPTCEFTLQAGRIGRGSVFRSTNAVTMQARFELGTTLSLKVQGRIDYGSYVTMRDGRSGAQVSCPHLACAWTFPPGTKITLSSASISNNYAKAPRFAGWSGDAQSCGTNDSCVITLAATNLHVNADFQVSVTIVHHGAGSGTVTSSPAGINCSPTTACQELLVRPGTPVTLTATPATGSAVDHWDADLYGDADAAVIRACGSAATCTVTRTAPYDRVLIYWKKK